MYYTFKMTVDVLWHLKLLLLITIVSWKSLTSIFFFPFFIYLQDNKDSGGTPVTLRVDPKGFYLYWIDQNHEMDLLDIAIIRDVRTGQYAKKPKVSNNFSFFFLFLFILWTINLFTVVLLCVLCARRCYIQFMVMSTGELFIYWFI